MIVSASEFTFNKKWCKDEAMWMLHLSVIEMSRAKERQ